MATDPSFPGSGGPVSGGRQDTIVRRAACGGGRTVTFLATDLIPGLPPRLWGVLADAPGDGGAAGGAFIRLGILGANDGWAVAQLLLVARARLAAEHARSGSREAEAALRCLDRAVAVYREAPGDEAAAPVTFEPGLGPSPYPWKVARCGLFAIALCPDPDGRGAGVTCEQLLAAVDLALTAWLPVTPWRRRCWEARHSVRGALAIEAGRAGAAPA